jgi:dolichyl-phosphate-mannose--protein O-mannosyl transferase
MPVVDRVNALRRRLSSLSPRAQSLIVLLPVLLVAAVIRLVNLCGLRSLVFDEVYYVRDAWTLWNLGYEATWVDGSDFANGDTAGFTTVGDFVAHPPLGKWLIGAGMAVFGPENAFGWRFTTAVAGIVVVLLTMVIARTLFRSVLVAGVAGLFVALDGIAISMSRTALLDGILTAFLLAAFLALLRHLERPGWGQWLVLTGALLGAGTAVKWNGICAVAGFGLWVVVTEALRAGPGFGRRMRAGLVSTLRSAVLVIPVAVMTYIAAWSGWLSTSGGYGRAHGAETDNNPVTQGLGALWRYHEAIYNYGIGLTADHGYEANPFGWMLMIRPTAFWYETSCGEGCTEYVTSVANPVLWYFGVFALGLLIFRIIRSREWALAPIVVGVLTLWVPWLFITHRTMFQFYTVTFEPFLMLAAAWLIRELWRDGNRRFAVGIVASAVAVSAFFLPVWLGLPIPVWFAMLHYWFPSWV